MNFGYHRLSLGLRSGLAVRNLLASPESTRTNTPRGWRSYGCAISHPYGCGTHSKGVLEPQSSFREQSAHSKIQAGSTTQHPKHVQILAGKMNILPAYGLSPGPIPFTFCTVLLRSGLGQNSCNKVTVRLLKVPKRWQQFCFLAFCATLPMNPECPSIFSRCFWVKFPAVCPCPDT